jgi:tetratricopeptide (TPR) repeat protein
VAQAQKLYEEGTLRYRTSDYLEAVEAFTKAHAKASQIENDEEREYVMNTLLFNLARAHTKAYDLDQDASRLRKAKDLLEKYLAKEEDLGNELDAQLLLKKTELELVELEGRTGKDTDSARPAPAQASTDKPRINGLMIGGIVTIAAGLGGLAVMAGGLVRANKATERFETQPTKRDEAREDIEGGNRMAFIGGVIGGIVLATGVVLLSLGARKRSKRMALVPTGTGVTWTVRF